MFVLETGRVAVLKLWDGQEHLLTHLGQGDCFGEMALMDLFPRSASVRAVEACSALELAASAFYGLYEKDLEQFALIQMNLGREVSRRLRLADERLFRLKMGMLPAEGEDGPLTERGARPRRHWTRYSARSFAAPANSALAATPRRPSDPRCPGPR